MEREKYSMMVEAWEGAMKAHLYTTVSIKNLEVITGYARNRNHGSGAKALQ